MKNSKSFKQTLLLMFVIIIVFSLVLSACGALEELAGAAGGEKGKPDKETGDDDADDGETKGKSEETKEPKPTKPPQPTQDYDDKYDYSAKVYNIKAPPGKVICKVVIKAGQGNFVFDADGNDGCYAVNGIGESTGTVEKVGDDSRGCQDISHIEVSYCGGDDDVDDDGDDDDIEIEPELSVCIQFIVFHTFRDGDLEVYSLFNGAEDSPNAQLYNLSLSSTSEDSRPSRSPNDQYIVFESNRDGNVELYLTDPYGSFQEQLTDTNANNINPMFLADNQTIVFQSDRTGNWDIFKIDIFTKEETQLTTDSNDDIFPFASPDRDWIVFQSNRFGNEDLFLLNVTTGVERQLTDDVSNEIFPAWSTNGEQIAYLSDEEGGWALYVIDYLGENKELIAGGLDINIGNHAWSPEGFRIAYQSEEGGNVDIWTYDFNTGEYYKLTDFVGMDSSPTWDCGGAMISFTTDRDGDPNVYQVPWQGGTQSYLTNHPATDKWSEWSPSKEAGSRGW